MLAPMIIRLPIIGGMRASSSRPTALPMAFDDLNDFTAQKTSPAAMAVSIAEKAIRMFIEVTTLYVRQGKMLPEKTYINSSIF